MPYHNRKKTLHIRQKWHNFYYMIKYALKYLIFNMY